MTAEEQARRFVMSEIIHDLTTENARLRARIRDLEEALETARWEHRNA